MGEHVSNTLKIRKEVMVASFYKFIDWPHYDSFKPKLESLCLELSIVGTILLSSEGINGTISGTKESIEKIISFLMKTDLFSDISPKYSIAYGGTFKRLKVRLKKETVAFGRPEVKPAEETGGFINPKDWNNIIGDSDTLLLDTRNAYECSIGTFSDAVTPNLQSFREFPEWADKHLDDYKGKRVAMFCTGGIRCEKASAYLLQKGFKNVVQLEGGILKYMETINADESKWKGECFVFDDRVSLQHGLLEGNYDLCHACRMPISDDDKGGEFFIQGVSCHNCYNTHSIESKARFAERQKQVLLATKKNKKHIGFKG
jgi:UPF0176 protein